MAKADFCVRNSCGSSSVAGCLNSQCELTVGYITVQLYGDDKGFDCLLHEGLWLEVMWSGTRLQGTDRISSNTADLDRMPLRNSLLLNRNRKLSF